jgi:periplasmic protein TonB
MNAVLKKAFNDLVFEGRNKSFGAYFLRHIYQKNILIASVTAGTLFSLALAGPLLWKTFFAEEVKTEKVQMVEVILEEPPSIAPREETPPPPPAVIEAPKVAEVKVLPPVVKPDEQVSIEEKIVTQDEMKDKMIGNENVEGEESSLNELASIQDKAKEVVEQTQPADDKIHTWVEETAEFPGGTEELKKYLINNLKYPKEALGKQVSGFVGVRFVINKDGSVSDVVVEKSAGYGMDEEAIRVIKSMPSWKPARQNGAPARLEKKIKIPFVLK